MKKRTLRSVAAVLLATMALTACGQSSAPATSGTDTPASEATGEAGGDTTAPVAGGSYTYHTYTTSLGNNWNPHTWETSGDDAIQGYVSSPLCSMSIKDSVEGVYQWTFVMADSIEDVTKDHQEDLEKYNVQLLEGKTAQDTESGYVFEIKLNQNAKWEDGTPINADTYIYSMKAQLDTNMKNYRANLYIEGESAVAGGYEYYYSGSTAYMDNLANAGYAVTDFVKGDDGTYATPDGEKAYFSQNDSLSHLDGTLADAVANYADYLDVASYEEMMKAADADGRVPVTDENIALMEKVITANADWNETADMVANYIVYGKEFPEVGYDETVGCYKVDDYTIRYVTKFNIDYNYFLVSGSSNWLVYEDLYEGGKDTTGKLVTTDYCTSKETTMSYGPYRIESLQPDKQMVLVQNENWFGYEKQEDGSLISMTNFDVDGAPVQQYQTSKVIIDVMDDAAAKQAFLKGELSSWAPTPDDLVNYATSEQLYKMDETYTMSFFFNCNLDNLKTMDASKGNTNSVVLSNVDFRKAFSLSIDRAEFVTATAGYKPAYAIMNSLYFYDVYNDPTSSYRNSEPAKEAVVNLYEVEYGDGKTYATLDDAYQSINGYNLTEAKELMKKACEQLVADGLYKEGDPIKIRIGWKKGAIDSTDNKQLELVNKFINAAVEGSGFGQVTFEAVGNITDRYGDTAKGEYAIGYGAWGGAAFYPFRNFQVYCNPDQYSLHEAGCWDPKTEQLTLNINGEDITMTWQDWSNCLIGSGKYATEDFDFKLQVTALLEENFLKKYYRIPLAGTTACELLSYQCKYYTEDYNIMYGFGGLQLMTYNFTDEEWAAYVQEQGGTLQYE